MSTQTFWQHARKELPDLLRLALPVVAGEVGWSLMTTVDTILVGPLGAAPLGAVSLGAAANMILVISGIGLILGLDTLVSQSFGAGDMDDCNHSFIQGLWIAILISIPLTVLQRNVDPLFELMRINPEVRQLSQPYMLALSWGMLPVFLYAALRRYLQSMSVVRPVMIALLSANLVNGVADWILIYGLPGWVPAMGVEGAGWATTVSRIYMALVLVIALIVKERSESTGLWHSSLRFDRPRILLLLQLGLPAAGQMFVEVSAFSMAAFIAGQLEPIHLAAHQIGLSLIALTFMVPLGVSSAGAVAVGQAIGRGDLREAKWNGWLAILLGAGFMMITGIAFATAPELFARIYSRDVTVITVAVSLLFVAAVFQIFDGIQVVTIGVLRGAGDTKAAMLTNILGYYVLGLPIGYWLAFERKQGVVGIWIGLSAGLIIVASILLAIWSRKRLTGQVRS